MKHFRLLILSLGLALVSLAAAARQVTVSGVVTDASGSALVGATVLVQGGSQGVTTDNKGQFTLNVPEGTVLDISFVGYEKQSVPVKAGAPMHITLQEEATQMGEVVVVGYGVQKKVNLTGAVSQISGDAIADKAAPNVLASLQGELPGVVVTQSSGQPGEEGFALQIRGHSSVNTISTLVLIDGIEGDLDMLNPNDIESISVLKDAASASIYGSKAAAGVILVTTKQGAAERVKVSYNGSYSFTRQGRKPSRINSWEEYEITQRANNKAVNAEMIEWLKNPNFNSMLSSSTALSYLDNTDWIRKSLNDWSHMQRHSLSVRGGSNKLNYMASVGYYERRGFFKYGPDDNNRFNFRANLFSRINRYLDLSIKLTADRSEINANAFNASKVLAEVYRCRTRMPVYFPQDEDPLVNPNLYAGQDGTNPIDLMKNAGTSDNINNDVSGQANLRIRNLVKGLQINLTASRKYRANLNDRKTRRLIWYSRGDNEYRYSQTTPNGVQKRRDNSFTDNLRAVADYDLKLGRSHNFHIMAGTEWENYRFDRVYATKDYMPDGFYSLNFGNSQSAFNSDLINTSAVMSFFGRFNYNFREKYLFEVNLRYDGSSRLAPANRWELFPSVSGGWVISKENFFRDKVKFIDLLKVRASWGRLGNANALGYYDYINMIETGKTIFGGTSATTNYIKTLASPQNSWEIIDVRNIGLDMNLLRNRLQFTGEYYWKRNINMLSSAMGVPSLIGIGLPSANVGELKTWGWEIDVRWRDKIGKHFSYWVGANLSDSQNELVKYEGSNVIQEGVVPLLEGYPLNTIWGYRTAGLYQETPAMEEAILQPGGALTAAGDVRYVNRDSDPYITGGNFTPDSPGDLVMLGTTDPRYTFGADLGFEWKGLRFSVQLQGVGKRNFLLDEATLNPTQGSLYQAINIHRDYWTPENTDAFMPRPVYKGGSYNYKPSDRWIQDAAYLRLKNITIGYTIPFKPRSFVRSCYVYVSGDNLWETTRTWDVFDPEAPAITTVNGWYAFYRAVTVGLNVSF